MVACLEMTEYRRPFQEAGEGRRPTLTWPRQIPLVGEPEDVVAIVVEYNQWLSKTEIPKFFVAAEPCALITGFLIGMRKSWPNTTDITVAGTHFIQERSADEIGAGIANWYAGLG